MSSIDPAARRAQRNAVRFETNRGPAGPPGDPRLLLADIEVGQAVTKDEDGNPVGFDVTDSAEFDAKASKEQLSVFPVDDYASIQAAIDAAEDAGGGIVQLATGANPVGTGLQMKSNVTLAGVDSPWTVWGYGITEPDNPRNYLTSWLEADGTAGAVVTFGTLVVTAQLQDIAIFANGRQAVNMPTSTTRGGNRLTNVYAHTGGINISQKEARLRDILVMLAPGDGLTIDAIDCSISGDILVGYSGGDGMVLTENSGPLRMFGALDSFFNAGDGLQLNGHGHRLQSVQVNDNDKRGIAFLACTATTIMHVSATNNGREYTGSGGFTTRYADVAFSHPVSGNLGCGIMGGVISGDGVGLAGVYSNEAVPSFPMVHGIYFGGSYEGGTSPFGLADPMANFNLRGCFGVPDVWAPSGGVAIQFRPSGSSDIVQWQDGSGGVYGGVKNTGAFYFPVKAQTLSSNGAVTIDAKAGNTQAITLAANATSSTITNASEGQLVTIEWIQDGGGSRTYVWPTNCKFAGGAAPSPSTTATYRDSVTFRYSTTGTTWFEVARSAAVR